MVEDVDLFQTSPFLVFYLSAWTYMESSTMVYPLPL